MPYGDLLNYIRFVMTAAGHQLRSQEIRVEQHKTKNDLLTQNDLLTETFIINHLKSRYPDIHIVSEEYNPDNHCNEGITVVIDPIDGTCNYAAGLSLFGIQTAIFDNGVCVGAAIYFPETKDMLVAEKGKGAWLNDTQIRIDATTTAADGILLISDYYSDITIPFEKQFALVKKLQSHFLKTRHFGAACVDFSMLAQRQAVAYITYYHKLWDIAPGLLIATEAGCVYGALGNAVYQYGQPGLVVANNEENLNLILQTYHQLKEDCEP